MKLCKFLNAYEILFLKTIHLILLVTRKGNVTGRWTPSAVLKSQRKKKKERERERDEHFYREFWLFESALKILSVANHCTSVRPAVHVDGFSSGAQFLCRHAGMICREEGKQLLLLGWRRIGYVAPRTFCFLGSFLFPCNTLGTLNRSCQCPQLLQEVII